MNFINHWHTELMLNFQYEKQNPNNETDFLFLNICKRKKYIIIIIIIITIIIIIIIPGSQ